MFSVIGFMIALVIVSFALKYLIENFPLGGLLLGLGLCTVPYFLWIKSSANDFRSDGSAAGGVAYLIYGIAGLLAFGIGIGVVFASIKTLRQGEQTTAAPELPQPKVSVKENQVEEQASAAKKRGLSTGQSLGFLLIGALFIFMGGRLLFGFDHWSCGRRGCDISGWFYSWGGDRAVGFGDILIGLGFFIPGCLSLLMRKKK
jgi:hypothetical protein